MRLLAANKDGTIELFHPDHGEPGLSLKGLDHPRALLLDQHLLLGWNDRQLRIWHLTPLLYGDPCRIDRNATLPLAAPLQCNPAHRPGELLWAAGNSLECWQWQLSGLERRWRRPVRQLRGLLGWGQDWLSLESNAIQLWCGASGDPLQRWPLEGDLSDWCLLPERLLLLTRQGTVWKFQGNRLQSLWSQPEISFSLNCAGRHLVITQGMRVRTLALDSGQASSLELLHPCVVKPLVHSSWALLPSYDGILYQLNLKARPSVVGAHTLYSSFEPTTRPCQLWGHRLFSLSPEGRLDCWQLS